MADDTNRPKNLPPRKRDTNPHRPRERTAVPDVYREPWERAPGEGRQRYQAFLVYRDQPRNGQIRRSLERAAHTVGNATSTLTAWSREDHWKDRVAAWDRHLQAVEDAALVRRLNELGELQANRLASAAAALQAPIVALLQRLQQRGDETYDHMSTAALSELVVRASRAMPLVVQGERLVNGMSTANVDARVSGDAQLEQARREAREMEPGQVERFLIGEGIDDGRDGERSAAAERAQALPDIAGSAVDVER